MEDGKNMEATINDFYHAIEIVNNSFDRPEKFESAGRMLRGMQIWLEGSLSLFFELWENEDNHNNEEFKEKAKEFFEKAKSKEVEYGPDQSGVKQVLKKFIPSIDKALQKIEGKTTFVEKLQIKKAGKSSSRGRL